MLKTIARQIPQIDRLVTSRNEIARQAELLTRENVALRTRIAALQDDHRWEQCSAALNEIRTVHKAMLDQFQATKAAVLEQSRRPPDTVPQMVQVLLREHYRQLAVTGSKLPAFPDVEFRCHSQTGEDGILLYIFSLIGTTNRKVLEICAGSGIECNAANLIINHGFRGLLFDGSAENIADGREFYGRHPSTFLCPPKLESAWITAENVNELVTSKGFSGEIDLLSLDLDGNDYWIWKALTAVSPRVVVLEFNGYFGPHVSATMPYQPDFQLDYSAKPYRCGATLAAFTKLGRAKGYRLVGSQRLLFNAFFVRDDVGCDVLSETAVADIFAVHARFDWETRAREIVSGPEPWAEV